MTGPPGVFIGVGSNIESEANIRAALARLEERVQVAAISTFYATDAVGPAGQPPFVNGVVGVATRLPPLALKQGVLRIVERELGRQRTEDRYAPRPIDLDLILHGDLVVHSSELVLPDPDIERRAFLAVPLSELAPDLRLPGCGRPIAQIAAALSGQPMRPLPEFTESLRRQFGV